MPYRFFNGDLIDLEPGKIVCVGRNYLAHIQEMGSAVPEEPVLFMKPNTALVPLEEPLRLPAGQTCHHELEIAALIGRRLSRVDAGEAQAAVLGYALALDLTLRDLQADLKKKGLPWERAKAFDGSCPLGPFVPPDQLPDIQSLGFTLHVNGALRQDGRTGLMIYPVFDLIAHISQQFTLLPGDLVLTGTPAGVGPLVSGDRLALALDGRFSLETTVH